MRKLGDPAVRQSISSINRVGRAGAGSKDRENIFPNDCALFGYLEQPAAGAFGNNRVSVGQPLRAADIRRKERGRRV